jgi:hypothetical protein
MVPEMITQLPQPCRLKRDDGGVPLLAVPRRSALTSGR